MIFKLVNESGNSDLGTWESDHIPRRGDLLVKRHDANSWGQVLKVKRVVHRERSPPSIHVEYHSSEQYL